MTTLQSLTLWRHAAVDRLLSLERRSQQLAPTAAGVLSSALNELRTVLDNLQVAMEHLRRQGAELQGLQRDLVSVHRRLEEFADTLPIPCVWTSPEGEIEAANGEAGRLLHVAASRLTGRTLLLFVTERERLADSLDALNSGRTSEVAFDATVRPRERRSRGVRLVGRRLDSDSRRCWFFLPREP